MKIIILGANGMLGSAITEIFADQKPWLSDIGNTKYEKCDIADYKQVKNILENIKPDYVINCAAYTNVEKCENIDQYIIAININSTSILTLAQQCNEINATMINFSSDYVFDGKATGYTEDYDRDNQRPLNQYGTTKLIGEWYLKSLAKKYYLIRTSSMFGPNGNNFVKKFITLAENEENMKVINDQYHCPTYTYDIAKAVRELIEKNYEYGTYHITNSGSTTWYDFACEIARLKGLKNKIIPIPSSEYPCKAIRPKYSILLNTKFPELRHWKLALKEYIETRFS